MPRSLSEILADLDLTAITVDPAGRVRSDNPTVAARLAELRAALGEGPLEMMEPNGVQCYCGGAPGSGCG